MQRIRVQIVDDSAAVRQLATIALSEDPLIEVVGTAVHGRIALEEIPQLKPDVVLLDLNLPRKDGREVLDDIRADQNLKHIPVIVLTTSTAERDILQGYLRANS